MYDRCARRRNLAGIIVGKPCRDATGDDLEFTTPGTHRNRRQSVFGHVLAALRVATDGDAEDPDRK
jgi:hypothetical protein